MSKAAADEGLRSRADTTDLRPPEPEGRGQARQISLVVLACPEPAWVGTSLELARPTFLLGRDIDSRQGLALRDGSVSRLHARGVFDERMGSFRLTDTASRNGTRVNGRRVASTLLSHGDILRLGDTLLLYKEDSGMARACQRAERVAPSDVSILLMGETGTGKEVLARRIHALSGRQGDFIAINCGSVPRDLLGSELFGHVKNAFSGAQHGRRGVFQSADQGTLLLDEIGDCPTEVQVALLRALQERAVRPVGADREVPVDARIVAATHQNLEEAVARGRFRADLYARVSQAVIALPPLRARKEDVLALARGFAREQGAEVTWTIDAAETLLAWHWPFNIRELQSLVRTAAIMLGADGVVDLAYLEDNHPKLVARDAPRERFGAGEQGVAGMQPGAGPAHRVRLSALLDEHDGNVSRVAKALGKPRAQVYRWIHAWGLSADEFRKRAPKPLTRARQG